MITARVPRKLGFVALLLISCVPVPGQVNPESGVGPYGYDQTADAEDIKLRVQYDKFKEITTVRLRHSLGLTIGLGDLNTLQLYIAYSCPGDSLCRPKSVLLTFVAVSDTWRFMESDRE